jgi:hypothetical protein
VRKEAGGAVRLSTTAGRLGHGAEGAEDAAKALGKAGEVPHPPPLSGKALEWSKALRDAPKDSPERARLIEEFSRISAMAGMSTRRRRTAAYGTRRRQDVTPS